MVALCQLLHANFTREQRFPNLNTILTRRKQVPHMHAPRPRHFHPNHSSLLKSGRHAHHPSRVRRHHRAADLGKRRVPGVLHKASRKGAQQRGKVSRPAGWRQLLPRVRETLPGGVRGRGVRANVPRGTRRGGPGRGERAEACGGCCHVLGSKPGL